MPKNNKIHKLEAIRGFAAIYVVFHHTFAQGLVIMHHDISVLFRFGQEAVILFFVLSGFVIKYSFEKSKDKSFFSYFEKRFLRIFIPVVIAYITNYFVLAYQKHSFFPVDWLNLAGNFFMLQDNNLLKPNVITYPFLHNTPLWSLSYEWWFYMLFFPLITYFKPKAGTIVYALAILSALSYLVYPFFVNRIFMYMAIWWTGVEIADLYSKGMRITVPSLKQPLLVLLACMVILFINAKTHNYHLIGSGSGFSPWLEVRQFGFAISAVVIAIAWNRFNWRFFSFTIGWFEIFSSISFGVYISHYFLVARAHYLDFINNPILRFFVYFIICLAYAYVVENIIYLRIRKALKPGQKPIPDNKKGIPA